MRVPVKQKTRIFSPQTKLVERLVCCATACLPDDCHRSTSSCYSPFSFIYNNGHHRSFFRQNFTKLNRIHTWTIMSVV